MIDETAQAQSETKPKPGILPEPVQNDPNTEKLDLMGKSRLNKTQVSKAKKNIIFSLFGIIAFFIFFFFLGVPLLIQLTLFLGNINGKKDEGNLKKESIFVQPPELNQTYPATHSAEINISGIADAEQEVNIYLNDEITDKVKSKKDKTFSVKNISLKEGENIIQAKALHDETQSNFSNTLRIYYLKNPPNLDVEKPTSGESYSGDNSPLTVKGKTDPRVKVTINDFRAVVDTQGNFSYSLPLQSGENTIHISATDDAGNKIEKEIKINYSP